jgi:hypothetical protein
MRTRTTYQYPARLEGIRQRFDRWRATREGRSRIPERLWASAVEAACRYGVGQVSRVLRLDYYSLKKRVETSGRSGESAAVGGPGRAAESQPVADFIELAAADSPPLPATTLSCIRRPSPDGPECLVELEDPRGAKMRIHLKGASAPDLAALSRSFWTSTGTRSGEGGEA